jgi:thiol-disulfide isomerase/thioredoxin
MKKIVLLSSVLLISFLTSCDKVKDPIQHSSGAAVDSAVYVRKVLVEDYTGHYCGNCPPAAVVAENLAKQYENKIVIISVHAGFFAKLYPGYPTSFTTTAGNEWDGNGTNAGFGISGGVGNPSGMVNRKDYTASGSLAQKETKWPTSVSLALNDTYILGLDLKTNYDPSLRALNTSIKAKFKTSYQNPIKLSVVLTEDSIIDAQKDYDKTPDLVPNYVFMHMLRGAINGTWGDTLKKISDGPLLANDSISVNYPNFSINTKFNDKQLYVVAFAYDAVSKEVLQVEKVKIR